MAKDTSKIIDKASRQIGLILAKLEKDCDAVVTGIRFIDVEDNERGTLRRAEIVLERRPGLNWYE